MKKANHKIRTIIPSVILGVVLFGCQANTASQTNSKQIADSKTVSETTIESTFAIPNLVSDEEYLKAYEKSINEAKKAAEWETHYAFYDIDGNGLKEFLTILNHHDTSQEKRLVSLSYLKNGLEDTFIGRNSLRHTNFENVDINKDGTIVLGKKLNSEKKLFENREFKIKTDLSDLELIKQEQVTRSSLFQENTEKTIDLNKIEWKVLHDTNLNVEELRNNQFQSMVGKFRGQVTGNIYEIKADGNHINWIDSDRPQKMRFKYLNDVKGGALGYTVQIVPLGNKDGYVDVGKLLIIPAGATSHYDKYFSTYFRDRAVLFSHAEDPIFLIDDSE